MTDCVQTGVGEQVGGIQVTAPDGQTCQQGSALRQSYWLGFCLPRLCLSPPQQPVHCPSLSVRSSSRCHPATSCLLLPFCSSLFLPPSFTALLCLPPPPAAHQCLPPPSAASRCLLPGLWPPADPPRRPPLSSPVQKQADQQAERAARPARRTGRLRCAVAAAVGRGGGTAVGAPLRAPGQEDGVSSVCPDVSRGRGRSWRGGRRCHTTYDRDDRLISISGGVPARALGGRARLDSESRHT